MILATEVKVGHKVRYIHNDNVYDGTVMANDNGNLTVIEDDNEASMSMWKAGLAVGTCIDVRQIVYHPTNQNPKN